MLDEWADVSDAQYCHNELGNRLLLAHMIYGECVKCYITLKVILLCNVLATQC